MDKNYQDLPFKQELTNTYIDTFFSQNTNFSIRSRELTNTKFTIKFGGVGLDDATVVLYFKAGGLTTIQYKTGRNHPLGEQLADFLYSTIDPNERIPVNFSLKGVDSDTFETLLSDIEDLTDEDGNKQITVTRHSQPYSTRIELYSVQFKDRLVLTHHQTNVLQIQGKPLFCYRNLTYSLSILLDQAALHSVISKTSDDDKVIVREDVAKVFIEKEYSNSFTRMDVSFQKLLVSSYCVKLASPSLPEYSMLLYADLRVLEGVIKQVLSLYGLYTDSSRIDIGEYFDCTRTTCSLKSQYVTQIDISAISQLEVCYQYYREQRHSLFHMSDLVLSSRLISTLGEVMRISSDIACKIDAMYVACTNL
ncbi:putative cell division protein [Vibrio cholerae]|uniref:type II toxin-antitoxin system RnlA family toxin n=1 Tax=Vibrio cholerae TaxID=666 RepID=UPI001651F01B|nr:type II toxin-antitoxin system RnlA family toxin [Vibrio cholerae]GIC14278.1 putative cell division protein [Vibrio cholerae]